MSSVSRRMKLKQGVILKQQSSKLQQKLSLLRSQVTQKKKQKFMNQTSSSFRATEKTEFNKNINNQLISSQKQLQQTKLQQSTRMDSRLIDKLSQIKLQSLEGKLLQKGINTLSKLLSVSQQEVDQWKDIAVGWRIKLKKLIKTLYTNTTTTNYYSQKPNQQQLTTSDNNIQKIIEKRTQTKIFVPLNRQYDQHQQYYDFDNNNVDNRLVTGEEEEQMLIDKLMKVLQPRKPILIKQSNFMSSEHQHLKKQQEGNAKVNKHMISWSQSVQQLQRQFLQKSHKTYPKQTILKQVLIDMQHNQKIVQPLLKEQKRVYDRHANNSAKYCWKCFKRIVSNNNSILSSGEVKFFCTQQCLSLYNFQTAYFEKQSSAFENQNY